MLVWCVVCDMVCGVDWCDAGVVCGVDWCLMCGRCGVRGA